MPVSDRDDDSKGEDDNDDDELEEMMDELADVEIPLVPRDGHRETAAAASSEAGSDGGAHRQAERLDQIGAVSLKSGWDDDAVVRCFDLALRSHRATDVDDAAAAAAEEEWEPLETAPPPPPSVETEAEAKEGGSVPPPDGGLEAEPAREKIGAGAVAVAEKAGKVAAASSSSCASEPTAAGGRWRPRPVPLPSWAVDPFYAGGKKIRTDK